MTNLKCSMCGSHQVLGPTDAGGKSNTNEPVEIVLYFTQGSEKVGFGGVRRASVCLDCGHVAVFVREHVRRALLEQAAGLRLIPDSAD